MGTSDARSLKGRCREDRGASAVEFALLLPLFVMLTIGTISAGFAFHTWLAVTHGAQESSRFAATLSIKASAADDGGTVGTWLTEVGSRAAAASNIDTTSTVPGTYICVAVVSSSNVPPVNNHMTMEAGPSGVMTSSGVLGGSCPDADAVAGDFVQTYVSQPVDFNYVLGSSELTVAGKSVSRYEAVSLS
jgi:Flp pilus assembly protein TadG